VEHKASTRGTRNTNLVLSEQKLGQEGKNTLRTAEQITSVSGEKFSAKGHGNKTLGPRKQKLDKKEQNFTGP
jgi:hypothetical protein